MICSAQVHRESFFEAQKNEPNEYDILNRAIFYVSRMISSQKEKDFKPGYYKKDSGNDE